MEKTALVIMAAGIGPRFGGGIKPLAGVGSDGEIPMNYSIHDVIHAGFNKFNKAVFIIRNAIMGFVVENFDLSMIIGIGPLEISPPSGGGYRGLLNPRKPLKIRQFIHAEVLWAVMEHYRIFIASRTLVREKLRAKHRKRQEKEVAK